MQMRSGWNADADELGLAGWCCVLDRNGRQALDADGRSLRPRTTLQLDSNFLALGNVNKVQLPTALPMQIPQSL